MKTKIKYIAAAAMLLAAVMMLCSCKALDEMKLNHAVYKEKGVINTVLFRGKTYELYGGGTVYGNLRDDLSLILDEGGEANLTEPDVPVLLSGAHAERISFPNVGEEAPMFFVVDYAEDGYGNAGKYYCEQNSLPTFEKMIQEAQMDHFFDIWGHWDDEKNDYVSEMVMASDEATKGILETIERSFNARTDCTDLNFINFASGKYLELQYCDKTGTFTDNQRIQITNTQNKNKQYFIAAPADSQDTAYGDYGEMVGVEWKQVDPKYTAALDKLFDQFKDRIQVYSHFYEDEVTYGPDDDRDQK